MESKNLALGLCLLGTLSLPIYSGVKAYKYSNESNKYKEQLATVSTALEETKQERFRVESRLEQCLASSENQNGCPGLSFQYTKLNQQYKDLLETSKQLKESVDSNVNHTTSSLGMSLLSIPMAWVLWMVYSGERKYKIGKEATKSA